MTATPRHILIASLLAATAAAVALGLLPLAGSVAHALVYRVPACDLAGGRVDSWQFSATPGRPLAAYTQCPTSGDPTKGLVVRTARVNDQVSRGDYARARFTAPTGTAVVGLNFDGWLCQPAGSGYAAEIASSSQGHLMGWQPGSPGGCLGRWGYWPLSFNPAQYVEINVTCWYSTCPTSRTDGAAVYLYGAEALIQDDAAPAIQATGGPLTSGAWLTGAAALTYSAGDAGGGSGIADVQLYAQNGAAMADHTPAACNQFAAQPCGPTAAGTLTLDTRNVATGVHTGVLRAVDYAGNHTDHNFTYRVDNDSPDKPEGLGVAGGDAWRRDSRVDLSWKNPSQDNGSPIAAARWQLCPAPEGGACTSGRVTGEDIHRIEGVQVPGTGVWKARVALTDAAGNESRYVSDPAIVRFDDHAPGPVAFESVDASDPRRIAVDVRDDASGVSGGSIEMAPEGDDRWQALPTERDGNRLVAYLNESGLAKGTYRLRAVVADNAGNVAIAAQRADGADARVAVPLRFGTRLSAGFVRVRTVRRHGQRRRVVRISAVRRVRLRRRASIRGRLTTAGGQPLGGQRVTVWGRGARFGAPRRALGIVTTDANGRFRYRPLADMSRRLTFSYAGDNVIAPASTRARLAVPASTTIRVHPRSAVNGQTVTFRGRLRGGHVPRRGVLMLLQAFARGEWRRVGTGDVFRSRRDGRWSEPYTFLGTSGSVRWKFRVAILSTGDYPFARGHSRPVTIPVRGL